jgi:hypothetical protein
MNRSQIATPGTGHAVVVEPPANIRIEEPAIHRGGIGDGIVEAQKTAAEESELFHELAVRCARTAKAIHKDMRDCHAATAALKHHLRSVGYHDARVLGCSVFTTNEAGMVGGCGTFSITEEPAHSVVLVSGYLIDPTAGQFRSPEIAIPDYLVLPPEVASSMLQANRQWLDLLTGALTLHCDDYKSGEFQIAYVPTDWSYRPAAAKIVMQDDWPERLEEAWRKSCVHGIDCPLSTL